MKIRIDLDDAELDTVDNAKDAVEVLENWLDHNCMDPWVKVTIAKDRDGQILLVWKFLAGQKEEALDIRKASCIHVLRRGGSWYEEAASGEVIVATVMEEDKHG